MFASGCETITALSGVDSRIGKKVPAKLLYIAFLKTVLSSTGFAREPWRFIVTCDSRGSDDGIEKRVLRELIAEIRSSEIDYYSGSGQSWQRIAQWPNTGWYQWDPIPAIDSTKCLIRISAVQDVGISDASDEAFTIFECRKQMPADLNGDCYVDFLDFAILAGDWLSCGNPFDASCD